MNKNLKLAIPPAPKTGFQKVLEVIVLRSWWLLLIAAGAYLLYAQGMHKKRLAYHESLRQLKELEQDKKVALEEKEDLVLQINSLEDPASIELMLMKKLGVVPEGQTKVHFENEQ